MSAEEAVDLDYPSTRGAECPYGAYASWRANAPVYRIPGRVPETYVVSRYDDVRFVAQHPETFSSVNSRLGLNGFDFVGEGDTARLSMMEADPPAHRAKRRLAFAPIRPAALRSHEPWITEIVDGLIDAFAARGSCEFVGEFARPLPVRVIMRLLDLSDDVLPLFDDWGQLESSGLSWLSASERARQERNAHRFGAWLTELVAQRHAEPGDDVVSDIIRAQVDRDGRFDLEEVRAQASVIVAGGAATTQHMMGGAMLLLLEHPDVMRRAREDVSSIPRVLEEAMRLESSVQWVPRVVRRDVELAGTVLPAGSYVLVMWASANRDPARFDDAERFDPDRPNVNAHMAFGAGPHTCFGAPLARLEGRIAFERLLARLDRIELVPGQDVRHVPSPSFRGLRELHLVVRPTGPATRQGSRPPGAAAR